MHTQQTLRCVCFSSLERFILLPERTRWGNLFRNPARVSTPEAQLHHRWFSFCAAWDQEQTGSTALSLFKQRCGRRWTSLWPLSFNRRPQDTPTEFRPHPFRNASVFICTSHSDFATHTRKWSCSTRKKRRAWQEGSGGYLEQTLNKQARVVLEGGVGPAQAWALPLGGREEEAERSDDLQEQEVEVKPACFALNASKPAYCSASGQKTLNFKYGWRRFTLQK